MSKKQWIEQELGQHMQESAGRMLGENDRFSGFTPGESSSGEMALDRIMEDDEQPRRTYGEEALQLFAEQLKQHGIQQPIQLRWSDKHDKWMIVYGHRRFRAAKLAGFATIPCLFADEDLDETTLRVRQLVENCQREDLKAMEMARGIQSLLKLTGWVHRKAAIELGLSHTSIGRYLDLLKLPEDLQKRIDEGELSLSVAVEVSRLKSVAKQQRIGHEIADRKLNRREAKARIEKERQPGSSVKAITRPEEILHQSDRLVIYRKGQVADGVIVDELRRVLRRLETELAI